MAGGYPCCCELKCDSKVTFTFSGMANDNCTCTGLNGNSYLSSNCKVSGATSQCSKTIDTSFGYWDVTLSLPNLPGCSGVGEFDNFCYAAMYEATDGKKYIQVVMAHEDDGDIVWQKQINRYSLPQTVTGSNICSNGQGSCDYSSAEILIEKA